MAEMDFIMQSASDLPLSSSHQQQHHAQSQGCPYLRSDRGHPTNLPNPHSQYSHPGFHAHGRPTFGLLSSSSNNRGVPNHLHPHSPPHSHPHPHPGHARHPNPHYDPVHAASGPGGSISSANSAWYTPPTTAPFQWPVSVPVPLGPHPHSSLQLPPRPGPGTGASSSSEPYFAAIGGGSVSVSSAGAPGVGPGPIQPGLLQSQHQHQLSQLSPHHEPFGSYTSFYSHQQPHPQQPVSTHRTRFSLGGQAPQIQSSPHTLNNHHSPPSHHQSSQQHLASQISQQSQPTPSQLSQISQTSDRQPQPTLAGTAAAAPRISLPALNPFPNPAQPSPPTMSSNNASSGESSPAAPPASRTSLFASPNDSPRASQTRTNGGGNGAPSSSSSAPMPPQPPQTHRPGFFPGSDPPRVDAGPSTMPEADALFAGAAPPANSSTRRALTARLRIGRGAAASVSDDSDEDPDIMDSESEAISFLEQFTSGNPSIRDRDNDEFRIRAHQLLRGQMTNKRVASRKALSQLQTVDLNTLEESERTCVICYNEFGVPNPEGINEAALRLPSCKHIFGDHCIKKWFEESDSCPYCRDKVPSELAIAAQGRAFHAFLENYSRARLANARDPRPLQNAGEPYVRIISTSTETRYDGSPPRAWQTGERRSPPSSDNLDTRRRTRPRHGSFRGSQSTSTTTNRPAHHGGGNSTAPSQASPARERVGHPINWPSWHQTADAPHPSLTNPSAAQFMPPVSNPRAYGYNAAMGRLPSMPPVPPQAEPLGMAPSQHPAPTPMGISFAPSLSSPVDDHGRYSMPPNGAAGASSSEANQPPPPQMNTYTQLPPMGALDGPSYVGSSSTANSQSAPAEPWLQ